MAIPRLTESAKAYNLNVTINVKQRPYFEIWYQRKKEAGETPEQFTLRILKIAMLNDHIADNVKTEIDAIEQASIDAKTAVQADIESLATEID